MIEAGARGGQGSGCSLGSTGGMDSVRERCRLCSLTGLEMILSIGCKGTD